MNSFNFRKTDEKEVEQAKISLFNYDYKIWDLTGSFNLNNAKENSANIDALYNKFKSDPNKIKKHYSIAILIGVALFAILAFINIVFAVIMLFAPILIIGYFYKKNTVDIIKLQIAKKNNWVYNPYPDYSKWNIASSLFPKIFRKGDKKQHFEDEFWGFNEYGDRKTYFQTGLFKYTIVTRDNKGRTHENEHTKHFYAFPLFKPINSEFYLYPENLFSKIGNFFTKKEINTESIEFNKAFAFSYNGKKDEEALEIVKTLSPAVQEKLVELKKEKGNCEILFSKDCVIFLFDGNLIKSLKTNFRKSIEINQEDIDLISKEISKLTFIFSEMSKYLD